MMLSNYGEAVCSANLYFVVVDFLLFREYLKHFVFCYGCRLILMVFCRRTIVFVDAYIFIAFYVFLKHQFCYCSLLDYILFYLGMVSVSPSSIKF